MSFLFDVSLPFAFTFSGSPLPSELLDGAPRNPMTLDAPGLLPLAPAARRRPSALVEGPQGTFAE